MRIALAGNPNSGKTTLFNALTGRTERVGNWAGVTVDKKEAPIKAAYSGSRTLMVVDLPGAYSMSPFTSEERITRDYVQKAHPDVIINIVDATNLSRSLFFTTQLLELGIPVVVALNKQDLNRKKQRSIDTAALSQSLGCPVLNTTATTGEGLTALVQAAVSRKGEPQTAPWHPGAFDPTQRAAVQEADRRRFAFVRDMVNAVEIRGEQPQHRNTQDRLDSILTHPVVGLPIFALMMFLVFHISQAEGPLGLGKYLEGIFTGWLESFQLWVAGLVSGASPLLQALLVEGIIGGFSAVVGFLPLVMVMYFLIALMEDCGYMARATVVLDPIFKKVGLSGKSVIPFIIGTGCAIPGVMACRTIHNAQERRTTAMLTPFMPCGAKLPVIALFSGVFFADAAWVGTLMYFLGIALILLGAFLVNLVTGNRCRKSYFIIELPEYRIPSLMGALRSMCSRGWAYVVKAGTVILVCNTLVQVMQSFNWRFQEAEAASESILATIAVPAAWLLMPIVGVCSWQLAAAAITGFIAKENVVGTLAVCFVGLHNLIDTEALALMEGAGKEAASVFAITKVAALSYLMFNLFTPPCFAALGAMHAELDDRKWFWGGVALQFATGYTLSYFVYTVGTLLTAPTQLNIPAAFLGLAIVTAFGVFLAGRIQKANEVTR